MMSLIKAETKDIIKSRLQVKYSTKRFVLNGISLKLTWISFWSFSLTINEHTQGRNVVLNNFGITYTKNRARPIRIILPAKTKLTAIKIKMRSIYRIYKQPS